MKRKNLKYWESLAIEVEAENAKLNAENSRLKEVLQDYNLHIVELNEIIVTLGNMLGQKEVEKLKATFIRGRK